MVDKEQQINESNQLYGQLQQQLEVMLDTIAKETNDIKKLEHQINSGKWLGSCCINGHWIECKRMSN